MLVALAIIGVLAGVALPALNGFIGGTDSLRVLKSVHALRKGINAYRADTHRYPLSLSQLISPPASGDQDLCGNPIPVSRFDYWHGPYLNATDLPIIIGDDTVKSDLSRVDAGAGDDQAFIRITVENVDSAAALELDALQGEDGSLKTGAIQWKRIKGQGNAPRLFFDIPMRGC